MRLKARLLLHAENGDRTSGRRAVDAPTTLRSAPGRPIDVMIRDLSQSGCFIETMENVLTGDSISIGLAGIGAIGATVQRVTPEGFGAAFDRTLAVDVVDRAFSQSTVAAHPLGIISAEGVPLPGIQGRKWPRPARAILAIGSAATLWALIAWVLF